MSIQSDAEAYTKVSDIFVKLLQVEQLCINDPRYQRVMPHLNNVLDRVTGIMHDLEKTFVA
jgi:hypothetical protein